MSVENKNNGDKTIRWSEKLGYGFGGITMALTISLGNYLTVYMTNVAFLDIAVISTILAVSRIFDGISDILVGNLIDKTNTVHGKARVWIRRMSIPLAVSAFLLYFVPKVWPDGVRYVYVFLIYNLFTSIFATFFIISHNSLLTLITSDGKTLRQLSGIAAFFQRFAFVVVSAVFVKLLMVFTDEPGNPMTQQGFSWVIVIIGGMMVVLCLAEFYLTKEYKDVVAGRIEADRKVGFGVHLKQLFANKYWVLMLVASLLVYSGTSCFDGTMSYYTLYVLEDFEAMSFFHLVIGISAIATAALLVAVSSKIKTVRIFVGSLIVTSIGIACVYLAGRYNRSLLIPALVITGIGNGALPVGMQALITEVLFYTQKTRGELIPGLGNAGMNAARKFGLGLSTAVFGYVMSAAGFNASLDAQGIPQPAPVFDAIHAGFIWIPIACNMVIAVIFLLFFDMEKRERQGRDGRQET